MNSISWALVGLSGLAVFWACLGLSGNATAGSTSQLRNFLERRMSDVVRQRYEKKLLLANLNRSSAFGVWIARSLLGLLLAILLGWLSGGVVVAAVGFVIGWGAIGFWLHQRIGQHQSTLTRQLPAFLDLLCMCLAAGMNLQTGVQLVLSFQPKTALGDLWRSWLLQVCSGTSRTEAFKHMLNRVSAPALRRVCVALIQAETSGSSMASTLTVHSQQLRQERLIEAERQALKAPVKMLLPLVVCFFPSTFLVLGFSIYVNLGVLLD